MIASCIIIIAYNHRSSNRVVIMSSIVAVETTRSFYSFQFFAGKLSNGYQYIHLMYVDIEKKLGCRQFQIYTCDSKDERDINRMQRLVIESNTTIFPRRTSGVGLLVFALKTTKGDGMPSMFQCKGNLKDGNICRLKEPVGRLGFAVDGKDDFKHVSFPLVYLSPVDIVGMNSS